MLIKGLFASLASLALRRSLEMAVALRIVRKFFPEVKTVVDANRNARIEVTKADEKAAAKKSHKTCAMAVACKRKFHLDGVIISAATAYLVKGTQARRFTLPPSVAKEVVSFDRGGGFEPGEYELSRVEPSRKLGARALAAKTRPERNGHTGSNDKDRKFKHRTGGIRFALGSKAAVE